LSEGADIFWDYITCIWLQMRSVSIGSMSIAEDEFKEDQVMHALLTVGIIVLVFALITAIFLSFAILAIQKLRIC
jgi:hypothetical protein